MITPQDRCELRLFEMYLRRRADKPDEPRFQAYAEIYGEIVFEDKETPPLLTEKQ